MRDDQSAADIVIQLMRVLITSCKLASLIRVKVVTPAAESGQMLLFKPLIFCSLLLQTALDAMLLCVPKLGLQMTYQNWRSCMSDECKSSCLASSKH